MTELNELINQYKETKDQNSLNKIFKCINSILEQKAKYIFYQQKYRYRGKYFKLCDTKKIELDDILQELRLEVLRIIKQYDITKPFENYFYSVLWNWKPEIVKKRDLFNNLNTKTETELKKLEEDNTVFDSVSAKIPEDINFNDLFENLNEEETKILKILSENSNRNQSEIARIIGVTQQRVSQILVDIRKKYKKDL